MCSPVALLGCACRFQASTPTIFVRRQTYCIIPPIEMPDDELLRGTAVAVVTADSFWVMVLTTDVDTALDAVELLHLQAVDDGEVDGSYEFADSDDVWKMPRCSIYYVFDHLNVDLDDFSVEGEIGAVQWAEAGVGAVDAREAAR